MTDRYTLAQLRTLAPQPRPSLRAVAENCASRAGSVGQPVKIDSSPVSAPPRPISHVEDDEQMAVIAWARLNETRWPALQWLFHVPNGGKRNPREAARLKAMGVLAGVSDLFLAWPSRGAHGLFVEMKAPGNKPTRPQRLFLDAMIARGYFGRVAVGATEVIDLLKWYVGMK